MVRDTKTAHSFSEDLAMSVPSDSEDQPNSEDQPASLHGFLPRSPHVFHQLPLDYRWQFTRRHPYYLTFWRYARGDFVHEAPDDPILAEFAPQVLLLIGVTSEPFDPAKPHLDDDTSRYSHWESGAVTKPTNLSLAYALVAGLSQSDLSLLSHLLFQTAQIGDADERFMFAFRHLAHFGPDNLASPTVAPFLAIDPEASQRAVGRALSVFHREIAHSNSDGPQRRRHDVLPDCLLTWDLREGWTGADYDVSRERPFSDIARELQTPITTLHDQYRAAFRYLSGHRYTYTNWLKLFQVRKLYFRPNGVPLLVRRFDRSRSQSVRIVPETRLLRDEDSIRLTELRSVSSDIADFERQSGILDLIRLGRTNDEIARELELDLEDESTIDWIEYARSRRDLPE